MTPHLADTPVLETERLTLRGPRGSDWELWANLATSERAKFIGGPYTRDMAMRAWASAIGHWAIRGFGMFTVDLKDGTPIGHVGHWQPESWPEREIGWTIWSEEHEGRGLAYEAASAVRDHTFDTLGWDTAVSYIDEGNLRSAALAERLGAWLDADAPRPDKDKPPAMVYRHPKPEALQ